MVRTVMSLRAWASSSAAAAVQLELFPRDSRACCARYADVEGGAQKLRLLSFGI